MSVTPSVASTARTPLWLDVALAVLFGLFYAYDVWEVVGSIVQILGIGLGFTAAGWVLMVIALLLPMGLFAVAFALGRRHGVGVKAALYFVGLAASAALFLTITVLVGPNVLVP